MRTLETERLILRDWEESDLSDFYEYARVEGVGEMAGWPRHESMDESRKILGEFIEKGDTYAVVLKESGKVIGSLGLHDKVFDPDYKDGVQRIVGYVLSKDYWGRGIMPEAVRAAVEHSFEDIRVDVLWCGHFVDNGRSRRVIEKAGFRFYKDGQYEAKLLNKTFDTKDYMMTREDYMRLRNEK